MNFKSIIILIVLITSCFKLQAQDIYPISKTEKKCLVAPSKFDFESEFEWVEVDCSELEKNDKIELTHEEIVIREQEKNKLLHYQKKLKNLGYKVDTTGFIDNKTITAHNKYLKRKRKEEKDALRKNY